MRVRIRAALAAAALLTLAGCSGTKYGATSGGGTLCQTADHINLSAGVIVGTATASCSVPPTAHHLALYLRYQPGGQSPPPAGTMVTRTSDAIPGPGADVTLEARHTCLPGTWWVQIVVAGTSPDGTPFSASDQHSYGTVSLDDCNRH